MRRILACVFLTLTFASGRETENVPVEIVEAMQKSVVPIVCMQSTGKGQADVKKVLGTGFLINRDGYFLTAAHVVLRLKSVCPEGTFWAIYAPTQPWQTRSMVETQWFKFTECRYKEAPDVAVCKTVANPFLDLSVNKNIEPVRFGTFANHADGSPVAFTGFPLESIVPVTSKGFIATYFARENWFGIDKSGWPGASGSPVYDAKGGVIGLLIRRTASDAGGLSFAHPIDPVLDFLRTEKIGITVEKLEKLSPR